MLSIWSSDYTELEDLTSNWFYGLCEDTETIFQLRFTWKKSDANTSIHLKNIPNQNFKSSHIHIQSILCQHQLYLE